MTERTYGAAGRALPLRQSGLWKPAAIWIS